MIKVTNNSFVFKFVGGEPQLKRGCHYCREMKLGGMICVYSNAPDEDAVILVCQACAVQGCKESEEQWADIAKQVALSETNKHKAIIEAARALVEAEKARGEMPFQMDCLLQALRKAVDECAEKRKEEGCDGDCSQPSCEAKLVDPAKKCTYCKTKEPVAGHGGLCQWCWDGRAYS